MPAIYNSLVSNSHMSTNTAWKVSFVVPGILITAIAVSLLLLCPDTPTGSWSQRMNAVEDNMRRHSMVGTAVVPGQLSTITKTDGDATPPSPPSEPEKKDIVPGNPHFADNEAHLTSEQMMDTAQGEVVRKPSLKECLYVFASPQSFVCAACYLCTFGAELSINSILGNYYTLNYPDKRHPLSPQESGNWAAMFGLLNVVCRPLGGLVADMGYKYTGSVWSKKILLHTYSFIMAIFLIVIGKLNPMHPATLYGLVGGLAFFLEGANGLNFALVPHVHPYANGVISGLTGASGNLGGIFFAVVFRYQSFATSFWILGVVSIILNALVAWIPPIPKGQVGGR